MIQTTFTRVGRIALAAAMAVAFSAAMACVAAPSAHAATTYSKKIMSAAANFSSSKYDITNDKKADRIKIKSYGDERQHNKKVKVFINGKRKLTVTGHYNVDAYLFRIKSGRTFLYLKTITDNGDSVTEGVWTYKSGKLKKVLNTCIWPNSYNQAAGTFYHDMAYISHSGVDSIKVKGNTVKIKFYNMTSIAGTLSETFSFKYKSGKLKLTSQTTTAVCVKYPQTKTLTAATNFKIYENADSTGKPTKLKAGDTVTLKAVQLRAADHFIAVKVTTSAGVTGWITYKSFSGQSYNTLHGSTLFQETGMAG